MGQNDRGREKREGQKDGPAHPQCTLPGPKPRNGPTHILAAAVWLKMSQKYFNEGMAKEACERFDVRAKHLSRVLTGRKYLGGTQARKHKATEEPPVRRKKTDS